MILLVGFYVDPHADRMHEFLTCIERNAANRAIDAVHVFVEQDVAVSELLASYPRLAAPKIRLVPFGRRVTYHALIDYANRELPGHRVVIANADIFFDHTLGRLEEYDLAGSFLCLSRCDIHGDGSWSLFDFEASQDAWIFESPAPGIECDFSLGLLGCDNRVAWQAQHAGLSVSNPSRSIRAFHLHLTRVRRYTPEQRLHGPTLGVPPVTLEASGLRRRAPASVSATDETVCAAVAFEESMGYTIDRLALGVSSHNNDMRPFTSIPPVLAARSFTQVVAGTVSPVEVEFLSPGRLFVLAGTDWHGYYAASDWLALTARPEPLPLVETAHRPVFEVWSLDGEPGDRFVAPTQVMLVCDYLERR